MAGDKGGFRIIPNCIFQGLSISKEFETHVSINKMMAKKGTGKWLNIFNIADSRNL